MARGLFVYLPAMFRFTHPEWLAEFTDWGDFLFDFLGCLDDHEKGILASEIDNLLKYSYEDRDILNFMRTNGCMDFPPGDLRGHFTQIKQIVLQGVA